VRVCSAVANALLSQRLLDADADLQKRASRWHAESEIYL
jgi:predicted nucleic acid-binding Zn ribbon protein